MSISVTKNQENFSPLKWAAAGAAAGCVVKELHPITEMEKDYYEYNQFELDRKEFTRKIIKAETPKFKTLLGDCYNQEGYDAFIKYIDPPKPSEQRELYKKTVYPKLSEDAQKAFDVLQKHVISKVDEIKKQQRFVYDACIKFKRPLAAYAFIGGLITTGAAFIAYVISKMSNSVKN